MAMMTTGVAAADHAFDLDVTLVETAPAISPRDASDGGCGAPSANSRTLSVA